MRLGRVLTSFLLRDAVIGAEVPSSLGKVGHIQRLSPNFKEKEKQYYRERGVIGRKVAVEDFLFPYHSS